MKKVLLTSTALVMTAGVAAAEPTISASAELSYGNFGTGLTALDSAAAGGTVPDAAFGSTADLTISGSGGGGSISYSASLEMDEGGDGPDMGPLSIATGGLTFLYDKNAISGIATANATDMSAAGAVAANDVDGEDNSHGDYSISYSAGGLSAGYTVDEDTEDSLMTLGYASGALTVSLAMLDETDNGGSEKATTTVGYVMGDATISLAAADDDTWDASVAYVSGSTTMTVATDENSIYSVGLAYAAGDMTFTARQEFNGDTDGDSETEFGLAYAAGDMTFSAKYDSGQEDHYGDEAQTVITASYAMDGVTFTGAATDQDEVNVTVGFSF